MNPILTITIDSADYIAVDRLLRVKQEEYKPGANEYVAAIIQARRSLGLSMHPADMFSNYVPPDDFPIT